MNNRLTFRQFLITGLSLGFVGWGGLVYCLIFTLPTLAPRWFFFFFLLLALSGSVLPLLSFIHRRFSGDFPSDGRVVVRQALWVGVFGDLIAWLQLGRVLSSSRIILLVVGFFVMEMLIRMLETSRWKPVSSEGEKTGKSRSANITMQQNHIYDVSDIFDDPKLKEDE